MLAQQRYVILDNIRSAYNVGAIFRTAEGAGVEKIFLGGYTPAPQDRFGRAVSEIKKTSLGASTMVAWEAVDDVKDIIHHLKQAGVCVVAVELTTTAVSLYDFILPAKVAYVFGNEVTGISETVWSLCDTTIMIPMQGKKESLNVATTVGIILFHHPYASI